MFWRVCCSDARIYMCEDLNRKMASLSKSAKQFEGFWLFRAVGWYWINLGQLVWVHSKLTKSEVCFFSERNKPRWLELFLSCRSLWSGSNLAKRAAFTIWLPVRGIKPKKFEAFKILHCLHQCWRSQIFSDIFGSRAQWRQELSLQLLRGGKKRLMSQHSAVHGFAVPLAAGCGLEPFWQESSTIRGRETLIKFHIQHVDPHFDVVLLGSQPLVFLHGGLGKFQRIIVLFLGCFTQRSISNLEWFSYGPIRFICLCICNPMSLQCASSHHCTHLGRRCLRCSNHLHIKSQRSFARLFWVHMQTSFCIAWVAFLLDFNSRVRMASDSEAVRPKHVALRICCWLGGLNNWAQLLTIGFIKFDQQDSHFHMLDNHVPMCTLAAVFVGIVCVVLTCVEKRHGSSGLADSTMAWFTCLPGAVLLADWAVAINTLPPRDHPFFYTFAKTLALMTYLQSLFALQLLTLARCHPCICIVATTLCTSLGCSCWQRLVFSEDQEHNIFVELRRRPYMEYCFLYVLVLASHLLDTWQKRQANHDEGLELGQLESTQTTNEENPDTQARSWYERICARTKAFDGPSVCMSGALQSWEN